MTIANGVARELRYKREVTWSVLPATNGAQFLRRVTSNLDLNKATYQSEEIRRDRQIADFRHGVRSVGGSIVGELSPGTYADFFRAACRQAFQTAPTTGTIASLVVTSTQPQYTRGSGSYVTDGFKIGDVLRWTGGTASGTANNSRNFMISGIAGGTGLSGFNLDGSDVVASGTQTSMVGTLAGKKTWVPSTGQLDDSFAFEHWHADISQSERFAGCKLNEMGIALPATGLARIDMQFMGRDRTTGTVEYFVTGSASGETSTGIVAAVNGVILVGTAQVGSITGYNLKINENLDAQPVLGTNTNAAINQGRFVASGQFTAFFEDAVLSSAFDNETEVSILAAIAVNDSGTADFVSFVAPRVKLGGAAKDDGEKSIVQTIPFQALLNTSGGTAATSQLTTLSIQDSQAT